MSTDNTATSAPDAHGDDNLPHRDSADGAEMHGGQDHPHGEGDHPHVDHADKAGTHGYHDHTGGGRAGRDRDSHDHDHDHEHPKGLRGAIKEIFVPHSHDAADSIDNALESSAAGIRAVKISLLVLGVTAIAQIVVVIVSGSIALAADTIHNFSDALTRGTAVDRVRAEHQGCNAPLHLRFRQG